MKEISEESYENMNPDNVQFTLLPNGALKAAGTTVKTIKSGIYRIGMVFGSVVYEPYSIESDELISIDGSQCDELFKDMMQFLSKKDLYKSFNFMHKRGYLLYGPQGTGKTSTVFLIAKKFVDSGGLVFIPPNPYVLTAALQEIRKMTDVPIMVIMEEFDQFWRSGYQDTLNLLDGESSVDGVLFTATTNNIENLPDNLRNRPGRFDRVVKVSHPSFEVCRLYVNRVLERDSSLKKKEREALANKVAKLINENKFSLAHTKELIVATRIMNDDLDDVIKRMKSEVITDVPEDVDDDDWRCANCGSDGPCEC